MSESEDALIEQIRQLPPRLLPEVVKFVAFLREREDDRHLVRAAARVSEKSFAAVWDNDEDAIYDRM